MYYMFLKQMELSSAKGTDENCCSIYGIEYPQREAKIDYFFVHRFTTLGNEWLYYGKKKLQNLFVSILIICKKVYQFLANEFKLFPILSVIISF